MPYTLILSHSSTAMAMVNQPVLSQELELFLEDKSRSTFLENPYLYSVNILGALASSEKITDKMRKDKIGKALFLNYIFNHLQLTETKMPNKYRLTVLCTQQFKKFQ